MRNQLLAQLKKKKELLFQQKTELGSVVYSNKLESLLDEFVELTEQQSNLSEKVLTSLPENIGVLAINAEKELHFNIATAAILKIHNLLNESTDRVYLNELGNAKLVDYLAKSADSTLKGESVTETKNFGGRLYKCHWYPLLADNNKISHAVIVLTDITADSIRQKASNDREKEHKNILNNLQQVVFKTDKQGNIFYLNNMWKKMSGFTTTDSLGKNLFSCFKQSKSQKEWFSSFVNSGQLNASFEDVLITKELNEKHIECQIQLIKSEFGAIKGATGILTDVTQQKKIDRKLHLQQIKQLALLKSMPDILLIQDNDEVYVDAHVPNLKLVIETKENFIGKRMVDVLPNWLYKKFHEAFTLSRQTNELQLIEYHLEVQGVVYHFETRILAFPENQFLSIIRDVTDQVTVDTRVKEEEEHWKLALAATSDGVWDWILDNNIVFFSDQWKEMLGYSSDEISNSLESWKELVHPDDLEYALSQIKRHLDGETNDFECEHRLLCKSKSYKWILSRGKIIEYDNIGKPYRFVGTHTDIDNQKKTEKKLRHVNATKDKFFSIISHDLRSPFSALIGFSEMLSENFSELTDEKKIDYVHYIHKIASSSYNLLENLLTWSRSQQGRMAYEPSEFNFSKLLSVQLDNFMFYAKQKEITFENNFMNGIMVYSDYNMIEATLRNLLSNAIKFSNNSGVISTNVVEYEAYVKVSIIDTGVGIALQDVEKMFRIEEIYTTYGTANEKGTGLGLILCKEFIEKNNGKIGVVSEVGKGSEFWFTLSKKALLENRNTTQDIEN